MSICGRALSRVVAKSVRCMLCFVRRYFPPTKLAKQQIEAALELEYIGVWATVANI